MARSIAGLFDDRSGAEAAVNDLTAAGFDPARIGVVMRDKQEMKEVAEEHGTRSTEGAVTGGIIGGSAGAILAAVGALVIPGIGPFISGGILATAVAGGAAGWLVGGLAGLGIPKEEAEYYEGEVQQGRALVTVDAQGRESEARAVLLRNGAHDLKDRGFGGYDEQNETVAAPAPAPAPVVTQTRQQVVQPAVTQSQRVETATGEDIRVPVMEEELLVSKTQQEEGRVRLHKEVVEERQTLNVPVSREEVHIERVAVSGNVPADANAFTERDISVPLMGEEVVTAKRAHVVEEVRLRKDQVTQTEQVTDSVRKERVVIEGTDAEGHAITDGARTTADDRASRTATDR